jgi:hypothetical protein
MFKKAMFIFLSALLILSLSSLLAKDTPVVSSTNDQAEASGEVQQAQKVADVRTVTVTNMIKLRPTRTNGAISTVSRDANAAKATGQSKVQSKQGEKIFQQPSQNRTKQLNQKNSSTMD